jgi:hypothetical protein
VGTEGFIPPEGPGTAQADLYSLGKVLYEISTGKDRHEYPELPTALDDAVHEAELSALNSTILKACRADPGARYRSAKAMVADLVLLGERNASARLAGRKIMRMAISVLMMAGLLGAYGLALTLKSKPANGQGSVAPISEVRPRAKPESLTDGLVGYWRADGNEWDSAGANDGEPSGVSYASGQVGQAFLFSDTNGLVRITASPDLDIGTADGLTLAAWICPDTVSTVNPLFEWNDGRGLWGVGLYVDPNWRGGLRPGALYANLVDTNHNWHQIISSAGVVATNTFQHVALTFDKHFAGDRSAATLYCNGVVVACKEFERFTPLTGFDLYLGRRVSAEAGDLYGYKGLMDEPAVFNRAMSSNEIRILYEAGVAGQLVLPPPTRAPAPSGLVSWWPADDHATDIAGGNNGVLLDSATFVTGRVGQAFGFSGSTNSYVKVPDSVSLRLTNELTIEFWVQRQKPFGSDYVVEKGGDWTLGALNYGVGIASAKFRHCLFFAFAGGNRHSTAIADEKWHHCAVTARNGDADPVFYIDGARQPVVRREDAERIQLYPSTAPLHIGALRDPSSVYSAFSKGRIDELSVYNRVLSASEIEAIYRAGRAGKSLSADGNDAIMLRQTGPSAESTARR